MALPLKYAGRDACADCHEDVVAVHSVARHQTVACEACHGPGAAHVEQGGAAALVLPRQRDFCPRCHGYDPSRPTGFPQIDPVAHNPMKPCFTCHKPHAPEPPHVPTSCAACHGEIARLKAVSHHALLPCTQCHETPDVHKDTPRLSRPGKPRAREFCGGCHATDAASPKEIPRVDLSSHNPRYVCWQCHYPHYPEVR
jgi:DnaJ-class molecular chaperone